MTWIVAALAVAALSLSVLNHVSQRRTHRLVQALVKEHNALVKDYNRRQAERRRSSGLGELLDAAGVPGGKLIGEMLDATTSEEKPPARRGHRGR